MGKMNCITFPIYSFPNIAQNNTQKNLFLCNIINPTEKRGKETKKCLILPDFVKEKKSWMIYLFKIKWLGYGKIAYARY